MGPDHFQWQADVPKRPLWTFHALETYPHPLLHVCLAVSSFSMPFIHSSNIYWDSTKKFSYYWRYSNRPKFPSQEQSLLRVTVDKLYICIRRWHPTPVLLPGKSHRRRSLVGCSPRRIGHDWATSLSLFAFLHWRRKWQPTPVFLPGESQGWQGLVGCRLWGCTESDTTEAT